MGLASGTKLGPYQVQSALGAGGMGEVYRATDSRLARDVALKVLPDLFARDTERMARFEREAKVLASLNHPNIAALYGLEESTTTRALVMELVEGPTLAQRIAQGPIPLDEAIPIARQIAEALEFAHERAIIHRDLKPANIKLTPDGQVKLLDFGLAKALEGDEREDDPQNSPTLTAATRAGVLLGTAAYMSPEQARGKRVDRRCDIWAFGCVLYEILTGSHAFSGETISDILAGVIRAEPEWSALPSSVPRNIAQLIRRCLQKDPRQRLRDIGEARIALEQSAQPGEPTAAAPPEITPPHHNSLPWIIAAVALISAVVLAALYSQSLRPTPQPVLRASLVLDEALYGVFSANPGSPIALSPDGSKLVFVAAPPGKPPQLYLRSLDQQTTSPVLGTENATQPFFSPDGQWIGFFADGKLRKVPIGGGPSAILCDAPVSHGGTWAPDDTIIFAPNLGSGLQRVSSAGGTPQNLTTPDPKSNELSHRWPRILPGGSSVLFTVQSTKQSSYDEASIALLSLETGKWTTVLTGGTYPRYAASGHVIYAHAGTLMAVPFDVSHGRVTGSPTPMQEGVITSAATAGGAEYDLAESGLLVFVPGSAHPPDLSLVWVDRHGVEKPLPTPINNYSYPKVSPDGKLLAVEMMNVAEDVYVYDFRRNTLMRLTFGGGIGYPLWMPDSRRVIYRTRVPNFSLRMKPADGGGAEQVLLGGNFDDPSAAPDSVSPDGKVLLFTRHTPTGSTGQFTLSLDGSGKVQPYLVSTSNRLLGQFSPDGHWVAYTSNESGHDEVYVEPYPGPGGKWMLSSGGGSFPLWAHNSRELFYRNEDKIMAVAVETQPTFRVGTARILFQSGGYLAGAHYDVAPDDQHFLMIKQKDAPASNKQVDLVAHWSDELKHRIPPGKN